MRRIVATALAVAVFAASPALADVKTGVAAWARKDYATAIAEWRTAAATGDPDAEYNLGQAYRRGQGVPADQAQAQSWYRKAADHGHAQAQAALGLMLFSSSNRTEAFPWLEKAAAQGEPRAQYVLGTALFNGDSITKDWPRAYALMSRAAASGLDPATRSLATMETYLPAADKQRGVALARAIAAGETTSPSVRQAPASTRRPAPVAIGTGDEDEEDEPVASRTPARTAAAKKKVDPKHAWRIQLGAFGQTSAAHAHWKKLSSRPGLRGLTPLYVTRSGTTRLQAGPFDDRDDANKGCAAAKKAGSACFAVAP